MLAAIEGPNRMLRAQSCHFWQSANAWVGIVSGTVWSAGLTPGTEIVEGKEKTLLPYVFSINFSWKCFLIPYEFFSQIFYQHA